MYGGEVHLVSLHSLPLHTYTCMLSFPCNKDAATVLVCHSLKRFGRHDWPPLWYDKGWECSLNRLSFIKVSLRLETGCSFLILNAQL